MSKRRTHRSAFKALAEGFRLGWVAMEPISGRKTIQEIDAHHGVCPIQVSHWE